MIPCLTTWPAQVPCRPKPKGHHRSGSHPDPDAPLRWQVKQNRQSSEHPAGRETMTERRERSPSRTGPAPPRRAGARRANERLKRHQGGRVVRAPEQHHRDLRPRIQRESAEDKCERDSTAGSWDRCSQGHKKTVGAISLRVAEPHLRRSGRGRRRLGPRTPSRGRSPSAAPLPPQARRMAGC